MWKFNQKRIYVEGMKMWEREDTNKHPEYMNLKVWGCEDTSKHLEYMNLRMRMREYQQVHRVHEPRIRGREDTRLQASTHKTKDMRMQGSKKGHINLRVWGCRDARIQACIHEQKDMRMQRWEDTSSCTGTWGYEDVRMQGYMQVKHIKHVGYFLVTCRLLQFTSHQSIYSICLYI